eukprot:c42529_g1_i1 orf=1-177(-)
MKSCPHLWLTCAFSCFALCLVLTLVPHNKYGFAWVYHFPLSDPPTLTLRLQASWEPCLA